jgi:quercetin dioxygenase-like cupin family protein
MTIFSFDASQELTKHTASKAAILQILRGEATITLGNETIAAKPNTWIYMRPNLPYSIRVKTQVIMLLTPLK